MGSNLSTSSQFNYRPSDAPFDLAGARAIGGSSRCGCQGETEVSCCCGSLSSDGDSDFTPISLDQEPEPGDLFFFDMKGQSLFKHAGVYCDDEMIVHFDGASEIFKESIYQMKRKSNLCKILRPKKKFDVKDFKMRLKKYLKMPENYSVLFNNCVHFVLHLLGMDKAYGKVINKMILGKMSGKGKAKTW